MVAARFNVADRLEARVIRLNKRGELDSTFGGGDGTMVLAAPDGKHIVPIATRLQSDGKAVVLGTVQDGVIGFGGGPPPVVYLARVTARGVMDATFGGGDGWLSNGYGTYVGDYDARIQSDGRIVVFGGGGVGGLHVTRYTASGVEDTSFTTTPVSNVIVFSGSIQPDGRLVATGLIVGSDNDIFVARLNAGSTLRKGQRLTARALLSPLQTVIPTGARFGLTVARSSKGACVVSRGGIKAAKPGTCTVTVSMTPPKTSAYPKPKTVKTKVVLTVTS